MTRDEPTETTTPPRRALRCDEPAALFAQTPRLAALVKLRPRGDEDGLGFLARLRGSTTPEEGVTFVAFAGLPLPVVGWGYECLRMMAPHLDPGDRPVMLMVASWLNTQSPSARHDLMRHALWAPVRSPAVLLALAAGWSTGGPAPNDPEPALPHKTPLAINSAVLSGLARVPLGQRSVFMARALDMAEAMFRAY